MSKRIAMTVDLIRKLIKEDNLIKFYKSSDWRKLRLIAIERDSHECQMCKHEGKVGEVNNVHHIEEVKHRPDLALDINNLVCLCYYHHNVTHEKGLKLNKNYFKKKKFDDEKW